MAHRRQDVVDTALRVLDAQGLPDLTMRRLAEELQVRPSALYHHVASKQELLAAVADEILRRARPALGEGDVGERLRAEAAVLRDALLAYRDGAEVVAAAHAFGLGEVDPADRLRDALAGVPTDLAATAATTVLHFVLGHAQEEQLGLQAAAAGVGDPAVTDADRTATFEAGMGLLAAGTRALAARR